MESWLDMEDNQMPRGLRKNNNPFKDYIHKNILDDLMRIIEWWVNWARFVGEGLISVFEFLFCFRRHELISGYLDSARVGAVNMGYMTPNLTEIEPTICFVCAGSPTGQGEEGTIGAFKM